jgi:hypothetical protein
MSEPEPDLRVGDVISMAKGGRGLPDELADDKYFRVEAVELSDDGRVRGWRLSCPYVDKACTLPYRWDAAR